MRKNLIPAVLLCAFVFALNTFAQTPKPKIIWKNLHDVYESFYDVKPSIILEGTTPILIDGNGSPIKLSRLDKKHNSWQESGAGVCGTGTKPNIFKLKPQKERDLGLNVRFWEEMKIDDFFMTDFTKFENYDGQGTYKLGLRYATNKIMFKDYGSLLIDFSPEFEVIEKDFKK